MASSHLLDIARSEGTLLGAGLRSGSGWFAQFMPPPEERYSMSLQVVAVYMLPVYLCYYTMARLVLSPGTRVYRLALLPLGLYASFRCAINCDVSSGNPLYNHWNYGHCVAMFVVAMRMIEWAFLQKPIARVSPQEESRNLFLDAFNLMFNMRGLGWDWSHGVYVPPETRPTASRWTFTLTTLLYALHDLLVCDTLHTLVQLASPHTFGSTTGGSILDPSLPPLLRYTRSSILTVLSGAVIYHALSMMYHFATVLALCLPGLRQHQHPADWPPLSAAPWRATSLADFWAHRWHQTFRRAFVQVAGRPLRAVLGRFGAVLGVFALSGVLHDWCIWGMGRGTDFARLGGFFVLNGVGVALEQAWERVSGRKVGGWPGWAWTMVWMTGTAHLLVDAWLERGLAGGQLVHPKMRPGKLLIEALVHRLSSNSTSINTSA